MTVSLFAACVVAMYLLAEASRLLPRVWRVATARWRRVVPPLVGRQQLRRATRAEAARQIGQVFDGTRKSRRALARRIGARVARKDGR